MALTEWTGVATFGIMAVAFVTYITNSFAQRRNRRIENLKRYFDAHEKLFDNDGFLMKNLDLLENGTYKRNKKDKAMEKRFNRLLAEVEKIAYLTSNGAVSIEVQVYMFGWRAQQIHSHITGEERNQVFWELAIHYIDELKKAADDYKLLPSKKREKYLKKNALVYKKYLAWRWPF